MIEELYPRALDAGIKPQEFWDYSFLELNDLLESYERERLRKLKERTLQQCQLGYVVAGDICRFMGQNDKPIRPWDLYPELFKEEREAYEIEEYKQNMRAYAAELNRRREV